MLLSVFGWPSDLCQFRRIAEETDGACALGYESFSRSVVQIEFCAA